MNSTDIAEKIAASHDVTKTDAKKIVDAVFAAIADAAASGEEVSIPQFGKLRPDIDPKLEAIIQKALTRDREQRYQSAFEVLTDLEMYLYSDRYGPTNEKLGVYLKEVFGINEPGGTAPASRPPQPLPKA